MIQLLQGDALSVLATLDVGSIQTVITSPQSSEDALGISSIAAIGILETEHPPALRIQAVAAEIGSFRCALSMVCISAEVRLFLGITQFVASSLGHTATPCGSLSAPLAALFVNGSMAACAPLPAHREFWRWARVNSRSRPASDQSSLIQTERYTQAFFDAAPSLAEYLYDIPRQPFPPSNQAAILALQSPSQCRMNYIPHYSMGGCL